MTLMFLFGGVAGGYFGQVCAPAHADDTHPGGVNSYQMLTGEDSDEERKRWDKLYSTGTFHEGEEPAEFVREIHHLLPRTGKGLEVGTGAGQNAVFLAKKGFNIDGLDISEVALRKAKRLARKNQVSINLINADLNTYPFKQDSYDFIINIDFLQRSAIPKFKMALKRKGVIVYQAATVDQLKLAGGSQMRKDAVLDKNELKELFKDFQILVYREINDGTVARARLVARKP